MNTFHASRMPLTRSIRPSRGQMPPAEQRHRPIITALAAVFLLLAALCNMGTPTQNAHLTIGQTCAAAPQREAQAAPAYWKMYYNFAPPTDAFIAELAAAQGLAYTTGKEDETRFYADDGRPIYPSNDGAVIVTLPAGDVLTRYGRPTGRYVSPDGMTFDQRALPRSTNEGDFHIYLVERAIDGVEKGKIAPWFGHAGGGIQHKLPAPIVTLMESQPPFLSEMDVAEEREAA